LEVVRLPEFKQVGVAVGQVETAQMQLLAMAARAARELQIHTWVLRLFTVVAVVVENERHLELLVQVGLEAVEMVEEMMLEVMQLQTLVGVVVVLAVRTLAEMVDLELLLCATRQTQPLQLMHRHQ
jgi:purine-nucleoside phosphorylase